MLFRSVGRGANLLLNVPPNRDGLLQKEDVASLKAFGDYRRSTFRSNLAARGNLKASSTRGRLRAYSPANLVDGRPDTYWAADDSALTPDVTIDLGLATAFNVIRISEAIRFGQRIDAISLERWNSGSWEPIASATSIGPRRLIRLEHPVTTTRLRLRVTQASASPVLSEFALFEE